MFNGNGAPSLSDIAAVTGNDRNNSWGDGNGWWVLIILFAIFGGWGNGGWGNNRGNGYESAATQADIQRGFDTQSVINKLNGIENGLCDGFYSVNTSLLTGTNSLQNTIQQGNFGIQQAINNDTVANMQNTNALATQLANCCCENRQGQAQISYDLATQACAIQTAIQNQTQQIMQNDNANYRALHDELVQSQMDAKDAKIAEQAAAIQALNLAASQAAQNQYLVQQLRPAAVPAFTVPNPYANYGYGCYSNANGCCNG